MVSIIPDASFLTHVFLPSQRTATARQAFQAALVSESTEWIIPPSAYLECASLLRKQTNQRRITPGEAQRIFEAMLRIPARHIGSSGQLIVRAWAIATALQQSDIFDSFGLAVAEHVGGQLWTCDRRFYNAAAAAFGRERIQYFP